jgi:hypothetical protein
MQRDRIGEWLAVVAFALLGILAPLGALVLAVRP